MRFRLDYCRTHVSNTSNLRAIGSTGARSSWRDSTVADDRPTSVICTGRPRAKRSIRRADSITLRSASSGRHPYLAFEGGEYSLSHGSSTFNPAACSVAERNPRTSDKGFAAETVGAISDQLFSLEDLSNFFELGLNVSNGIAQLPEAGDVRELLAALFE